MDEKSENPVSVVKLLKPVYNSFEIKENKNEFYGKMR